MTDEELIERLREEDSIWCDDIANLAAALLADVPRYEVSGYDVEETSVSDGNYVHYSDVLAALSAHLDSDLAKRVDGLQAAIRAALHDGCPEQRDTDPYKAWHEARRALANRNTDLITALLAQNAALKGESNE